MSTSQIFKTLQIRSYNEVLPMLEKGNYIQWESRFRRFLDNKLEEGDRMWRSIGKGPYKKPMIANPDNTTEKILEPLSKMTERNKKKYTTDVKVMNYILQAIPNDIYNSVDASKEGESLESVYERLTTLVNIMDRNNVPPIQVSINTKFLNFLQLEWTSKARKAAKNHDPLALLAHSNASSSQSHANYSYSPQSYYAHNLHPLLIMKMSIKGSYKGILKKISYINLLWCYSGFVLSTLKFYYSYQQSNYSTSSNTRNQAVIQDGNGNDDRNQIVQRVPRTESTPRKANVQCYNCYEKGHYACDCQKPRVRDAKYFREQMLLAIPQDEAEAICKGERK
ncbi:putative ribonuclease H-like domain-containing protein [Tanacetum coccineum]